MLTLVKDYRLYIHMDKGRNSALSFFMVTFLQLKILF